MGRKRPPRIPGFDYLGLHAYSLTVCTEERHRAFEDSTHAKRVCTQFLQSGADYRFEIIVHCVMPDHAHALVAGQCHDSDFVRFVSMLKQRSSYRYRQTTSRRLWQEGFFDHVLRDDESLLGVSAYIVNNPIRARLCANVSEYPYLGSSRFTIQELIDAVQIKPGRSRP
jgi:putative transposase